MEPLKDYPHLLANKKFGIKEVFDGGNWTHEGFGGKLLAAIQADPDRFTLIARPIEDMTDEECTESILFDCIKDKAEPIYIREELVKMNSLARTMRLSLYLLSIGVYPFDQQHFNDGTVININKV